MKYCNFFMLFIETDFHLDIKVIFSIDPWFYLNINEKREENMRKFWFPSEMRKFHWFYNTLNPQFYAIIFLILLLEFWLIYHPMLTKKSHEFQSGFFGFTQTVIPVFWIHSNSNQIQLARLGSKIVYFFKLTPRLGSRQSQCNGNIWRLHHYASAWELQRKKYRFKIAHEINVHAIKVFCILQMVYIFISVSFWMDNIPRIF